jgi:uncharacterized membrane protein
MSSRRHWGSVDEAAMPEIVFELKTWKDDAAPVVERTVERVETLEDAVRGFEKQLASATSAVKAVLWVLGLLWTIAIAVLGFVLKGH